MNPDQRWNSCEAEQQPLVKLEEMIYTKYTTGSIVWAVRTVSHHFLHCLFTALSFLSNHFPTGMTRSNLLHMKYITRYLVLFTWTSCYLLIINLFLIIILRKEEKAAASNGIGTRALNNLISFSYHLIHHSFTLILLISSDRSRVVRKGKQRLDSHLRMSCEDRQIDGCHEKTTCVEKSSKFS